MLLLEETYVFLKIKLNHSVSIKISNNLSIIFHNYTVISSFCYDIKKKKDQMKFITSDNVLANIYIFLPQYFLPNMNLYSKTS